MHSFGDAGKQNKTKNKKTHAVFGLGGATRNKTQIRFSFCFSRGRARERKNRLTRTKTSPRDFAWDITEPYRCHPDGGAEVQEQPILVLFLGSVLKAMGDPDWTILGKYAVGVPLGLGVDLPRPLRSFRQSFGGRCQSKWTGEELSNAPSISPAAREIIMVQRLSTRLRWRRSCGIRQSWASSWCCRRRSPERGSATD